MEPKLNDIFEQKGFTLYGELLKGGDRKHVSLPFKTNETGGSRFRVMEMNNVYHEYRILIPMREVSVNFWEICVLSNFFEIEIISWNYLKWKY